LNDETADPIIRFEGSSDLLESQLRYSQWGTQLPKFFVQIFMNAVLNNPEITLTDKRLLNESVGHQFSELSFQVLPEMKAPLKEMAEYIDAKAKKVLDNCKPDGKRC
jgi:hypothetical protein